MTLPKTFIGSYFVLVVWHRQPHIGKEADWISPLTAVEEAAAACSGSTSEGWFDWIEVQKLKLCNLRSDRAKNFSNLRTRGTLVLVVVVVGKRLLKVNSFCPSFSVSLEPRLAAFNHSMVQSFCMRAKKRQCYCKLLSLFAKALKLGFASCMSFLTFEASISQKKIIWKVKSEEVELIKDSIALARSHFW